MEMTESIPKTEAKPKVVERSASTTITYTSESNYSQTYQRTPGSIWHLGQKINNTVGTINNTVGGETLIDKTQAIYDIVSKDPLLNHDVIDYEVSIVTLTAEHSEASICEAQPQDPCNARDVYVVNMKYRNIDFTGFLSTKNTSEGIKYTQIVNSSIEDCMLINKKLYTTQGELLSCYPTDDPLIFEFRTGFGKTADVYMELYSDATTIGATLSPNNMTIDGEKVVVLTKSVTGGNIRYQIYLYRPSETNKPIPLKDARFLNTTNDANKYVNATLTSSVFIYNGEIYRPCFNMRCYEKILEYGEIEENDSQNPGQKIKVNVGRIIDINNNTGSWYYVKETLEGNAKSVDELLKDEASDPKPETEPSISSRYVSDEDILDDYVIVNYQFISGN